MDGCDASEASVAQPDPYVGLPLDRLHAWMEGQGIGKGALSEVRPLTGGTQNPMFRFRRGRDEFVLRRPPASPLRDGSATIAREVQILSALETTDIPHPRLIAYCPDAAVVGASFYLMEAVDGFSPAVSPERVRSAADGRQIGFALIDGLRRLESVDTDLPALEGLGRKEGFVDRQVSRWLGQFERYGEFAGWDGSALRPAVARVSEWLDRNRPSHFRLSLMHGDYHIANVIVRPDRPELAAIVDWEVASFGDSLLDLGWVLATWPDEDVSPVGFPSWPGMPTAEELIAYYRANGGHDLAALPWYRVLACFKLAVLLEGSYARACAGLAPSDIGARLHGNAAALLARASRLTAST